MSRERKRGAGPASRSRSHQLWAGPSALPTPQCIPHPTLFSGGDTDVLNPTRTQWGGSSAALPAASRAGPLQRITEGGLVSSAVPRGGEQSSPLPVPAAAGVTRQLPLACGRGWAGEGRRLHIPCAHRPLPGINSLSQALLLGGRAGGTLD